jgi:predicted CopG family antitoxin
VKNLRTQVNEYLKHKQGVWVLFDNLDKGWSTQGVDVVDAMVLRCLIDAGRKVERDMRKAGNTVHCLVFIRNDVYEHLMKQSADYGKEMRVTLDWTDPDMLRELLRLRLVASLPDESHNLSFEQIWRQLCVSHYKGEETSSYIIERALMRPRNVIKIFAHAKGFASNLAHTKIDDSDLEKGVRAYSQDLLVELDHELSDVFPVARDLLYQFIDAPPQMSRVGLEVLIRAGGTEESEICKVVDFLLYYGILGVRTAEDQIHYIFNVNYDLKVLQVRAARITEGLVYVMNPAFRPALGITEAE